MNDHKCSGLGHCPDHPRWHVARTTVGSTWPLPWFAFAPSHVGYRRYDTFPEAFAYATAQARAAKVAAIQDGAA